MTQPIRHRADTGLEYRCQDCRRRNTPSWWPITEEFWSFSRGFSRCRACWVTRDRDRIRDARTAPARRAADRAYAAAYYAGMSPDERRAQRAKKLAYQREWMRAYRAEKRERAA